MSLDQFRGLLYGVALGDALGKPYEFRYGRMPYSPQLSSGQARYISDDTEMMLALLKAIRISSVKKGFLDYNREDAIYEYILWSKSDVEDIGGNTRTLFFHPITRGKDHAVKMYERVFDELTSHPKEKWSQSNGCLMRCAPLAFFIGSERSSLIDVPEWIQDCEISNPHLLCLHVTDLYFRMIRNLLLAKSKDSRGYNPEPLTPSWSDNPAVCNAIRDALEASELLSITDSRHKVRQGPREVNKQRGWILHAFYFACVAYVCPFDSFTQAMDFIIGCHLDSDTDTNAAIAGAILGCKYGYEWMIRDEDSRDNIKLIVNQTGNKDTLYHPSEIEKGLQELYSLLK